ncbi:MAG: glycosyltransferase, partial [Polaribacter sp.]
ADLYVQTSRHEGYGLSIAEARLLNVPVVTTRYDSVYVQMIHEKNGLVVDIDANAVADGIERMINDKVLYESVKSYLKSEEKENKESIQRFYKLIDN